MNNQECLELIETSRRTFENLLLQATGIEVEVEVHIHPSFQDTRALAVAAQDLEWHAFHSPGLITYRLPRMHLSGITKLYVLDEVYSQARFVSLATNPLHKDFSLLDRLTAWIALARLSVYDVLEEEV